MSLEKDRDELLTLLQSHTWWCDYINGRYRFSNTPSKDLLEKDWLEGLSSDKDLNETRHIRYKVSIGNIVGSLFLHIQDQGNIVMQYEGTVKEDGTLVFNIHLIGQVALTIKDV